MADLWEIFMTIVFVAGIITSGICLLGMLILSISEFFKNLFKDL